MHLIHDQYFRKADVNAVVFLVTEEYEKCMLFKTKLHYELI